MRVTSPEDLKITGAVEEIVNQIEAHLQSKDILVENGVVRIILNGNFTAEDRQKVVVIYRNAGWDFVSHITSYENGQSPGATLFTLIKK
jgi:hypothetical protein